MLNLRYIIRLVGAFFSKFKVLILICVGLGVLAFFLLSFLLPRINTTNSKRIGITGKFTTSSLPTEILKQVGSGLTKIEADGSVVPDLASSWETPDKGKTWIFTLKDNIYWQDEEKITSKSISYQFSDVTLEYPDDKTITFKLQNSYSAFPGVVAKPVFKSGLLGTGEWKVTKISLNGSTVEQISLYSKDNGKITYKFYPTDDSTKTAFKLGLIDEIQGIFTPTPFDSWNKVNIEKQSVYGQFVAVFFNSAQGSIFAEKNLRQALSYAIDKSNFNEERAISPISKDSWAYNPQVKPYDYDPTKAKQMIDEYKKASKIGDLTINLATSPTLLSSAEIIKKDWEKVGITVNLQVLTTIPAEYQAFLAIYDTPDDPDQYSIWHSTQTSTNITHYSNPRIDKLLEDGRSEIDIETRRKTYLDFQRFLLEDSPAAFLYYPSVYTVAR